MGVAQAGWTDPSPPMRLAWERGGAISWPEVAAWAEATELVCPSSPGALHHRASCWPTWFVAFHPLLQINLNRLCPY